MDKVNEKKIVNTGRTMPFSNEAERSLLGCLILSNDIALEVMGELHYDSFYVRANQYIYEAMLNVSKKGRPIDIVTLQDELDSLDRIDDVGGMSYLAEVATCVPSSANYKHYKDIVTKNAMRRKVIKSAQEIIEQTYQSENDNDAISFAEKKIFEIGESVDTSSLVNLDEAFSDVMIKFNKLQTDRNAYKGLNTGFTDLDYITNGLQNSDLILVAARPGVGKTSFTTNIIEHISIYNKGVSAVFSLEMPRLQLAQRMMCSIANVSMSDALKGKLGIKEWQEIYKAKEMVSNAKIFVDDSSLVNPREMLSKCRRLKSKMGLDVVMIDYIQLMSGDKKRYDSRQQEVSEISRNLKIMAKELNVPVIALSQLSRQAAEKDTTPQLIHLRESGAIEQDADIVMFIHRPDKIEANAQKVQEGLIPKDVAELIIAKHRNGAIGSVKLKWIGEMTKFVNFDKRGDELAKRYNITNDDKKQPVSNDEELEDDVDEIDDNDTEVEVDDVTEDTDDTEEEDYSDEINEANYINNGAIVQEVDEDYERRLAADTNDLNDVAPPFDLDDEEDISSEAIEKDGDDPLFE